MAYSMNLIDLLQALGPSRKTVRITLVQSAAPDEPLTLHLNQGAISHATYRHETGAEAVYACIGWTDGSWRVEPVSDSNLPEPNNQLSNESILMEGCRRLDEQVRAGDIF